MRIRTLMLFFWLILIGAAVATERHGTLADTAVDIMAKEGNTVPVTLFPANRCLRN